MQNFLEPNGEFVVFGDPKQNIYNRPTEEKTGDVRLGVIGGTWNKELSTGHRFTNSRLAQLAMLFQSTFSPKDIVNEINTTTDSQTSLFKIVTYYNIKTTFTMDNLVSRLVNIIKSSNQEPKCFVVLASSSKMLRLVDFKYRQLTGEKTEITFVSTEQFERLKQLHHVSDEHMAN